MTASKLLCVRSRVGSSSRRKSALVLSFEVLEGRVDGGKEFFVRKEISSLIYQIPFYECYLV